MAIYLVDIFFLFRGECFNYYTQWEKNKKAKEKMTKENRKNNFKFFRFVNYLVDGTCLMFAYGVSAYWSYPSPLSFELSQCVLCWGRNRFPGSTLPAIRAAECNLPGNALPGCRFDGIRNTFRWTRDVMVGPVDMVIRITNNKHIMREKMYRKFINNRRNSGRNRFF